jgi:hypothetical protein
MPYSYHENGIVCSSSSLSKIGAGCISVGYSEPVKGSYSAEFVDPLRGMTRLEWFIAAAGFTARWTRCSRAGRDGRWRLKECVAGRVATDGSLLLGVWCVSLVRWSGCSWGGECCEW